MAEPVLRNGSSGEAVRELQVALQETGHNPGPIDGVFGAQTEAAVKAFQEDRGIGVDGVVGLITWRNIDEFAEFDEPVLREGSTGLPVQHTPSRLTVAGFDPGGWMDSSGRGRSPASECFSRPKG